jgi:polysaccharide biosynthesis/export protein
MYSRLFSALLVGLLLTAAAISQTPATDTSTQRGYMIGPGDEITGKVLGESQFDFVATVDENGKIELPFFDQPVIAKCLSERDLRTEVTKLLSKYLRTPQLSLRVTDRKSRPPVSIYGEVRQQQQVILTRRAYLLELITVAGGETDKSGGMIQVFRTRPPMCGEATRTDDWKVSADDSMGAPSRIYSLTGLKQGDPAANPEIFPGDIIVVQKAAPIYIIGEVRKPGEFGIPEEGLALSQAIALASGITREAKSKSIKIYRRKQGSPQPEVLIADYNAIRKGEQPDPVLTPFDIVEVGKAPKKFTDYLIEFAIGIPNRIPITY